MPSIPIHTSPKPQTSHTNPLPTVLQTPAGLALIEIQGTIHAPFPTPSSESSASETTQTSIGRLEFPLYSGSVKDDDGKWMKKVYMYVGKHQRLTGEVKKLPKAMAVLRKIPESGDVAMGDAGDGDAREELEIAEIIKWKILFAGRPEPVGIEEG
jgi:chromosome transmission fidelity protein 8